jgi:hypothetical protein
MAVLAGRGEGGIPIVVMGFAIVSFEYRDFDFGAESFEVLVSMSEFKLEVVNGEMARW